MLLNSGSILIFLLLDVDLFMSLVERLLKLFRIVVVC